ncbi:fimbrial protein [Enterobacter sp. 186315]
MLKKNLLFAFLIFIGFRSWAAGDCVAINQYPVISFSGNIQVDPSAAIGSAIATGQTQMVLTNLTPQYQVQINLIFASTLISNVTYSVNSASVHSTNIDGVGISVWSDNSVPKKNSAIMITKKAAASAATTTHNIYYALIKTANVASSGTPNSVVFNSFLLACDAHSSGMSNYIYNNIAITGNPTVTAKACTVNNPAINVPLGTTKNTAFTGVGSTANTQTFNISLTCSQAASAKITLSPGSSGAFNAANGVINLDPATAGTVATGVGIQLLYNNAAAPLNSAISVGSVAAAGNLTVPLSARYYQTASTVTGGVANGTATFTMTYN